MEVAGVAHDFHTLLSNAGLERFVEDQPFQYAMLSMSVVQDFRCNLNSPNPTVHYKIYNKSVDLPFGVFCSAMRVPHGGSLEKLKGKPKAWMDL